MTDLQAVGLGIAIATALIAGTWTVAFRVFRERIEIETRLRTMAEQELTNRQQRVDELTQTVGELMQKVAEASAAAEFVEEGGVLFKRRADGGYHDVVFCAKCRLPLLEVVHDGLWCTSCKARASARSSAVPALRDRLPTSLPPAE